MTNRFTMVADSGGWWNIDLLIIYGLDISELFTNHQFMRNKIGDLLNRGNELEISLIFSKC